MAASSWVTVQVLKDSYRGGGKLPPPPPPSPRDTFSLNYIKKNTKKKKKKTNIELNLCNIIKNKKNQ